MEIHLVTSEGKDIYRAVDQVRTLCKEIGLLLQTAETQLGSHGWIMANRAAAAGGSTSIDFPAKWVPESVHRFMKHERRERLLSFVSVILENLDQPDRLDEPLVTAGWIDFGQTGESLWYPELSRWHLYNPNRSDDGISREFQPGNEFSAKARENVHCACTLAVPLVNIIHADALENLVIHPFLASLPDSPGDLVQ